MDRHGSCGLLLANIVSRCVDVAREGRRAGPVLADPLMPNPKASTKPTAQRPSGLTAQRCADALSLLACAACCDAPTNTSARLAVIGGFAFPLSMLALPLLSMGFGGRLAMVVVTCVLASFVVRIIVLYDMTRKLDQSLQPSAAAASAFLFVPETIYRAISSHTIEPAVELWSSASGTLSICGVPPLEKIRSLTRDAHAQPILIVNLCAWWVGWRDMYDQLGIEQMRYPCGSSDVVAIVAALKKALNSRGGEGEAEGGSARPLRVILHCESGAFAAAVATAFLCAIDLAAEPSSKAVEVASAVGARLPCHVSEGERLARLVCELTGGKGSRGKKGKVAAAAATTPTSATAARPLSSSDEDEEDGPEAMAAAERQARAAHFQSMVAKHGLPQPGKARPAAAEIGSGWSEVKPGGTRPMPSKTAAGASYAATARIAQEKANAEMAEAERLEEKQRKNRRKAAKAKEESARREADQKARLAETIRSRAQG